MTKNNKSRTEKAFDYAYEQALPEYGEGWDDFANHLKSDMLKMEAELRKQKEKIQRLYTLLERSIAFHRYDIRSTGLPPSTKFLNLISDIKQEIESNIDESDEEVKCVYNLIAERLIWCANNARDNGDAIHADAMMAAAQEVKDMKFENLK